MIVNTKDALLVIDKSQVQDVKKVVEYLKINQRSEYKHHRDIYRPWGKSDLVVAENRFNVNRVTVNPGEIVHPNASSPCRTLDNSGRHRAGYYW